MAQSWVRHQSTKVPLTSRGPVALALIRNSQELQFNCQRAGDSAKTQRASTLTRFAARLAYQRRNTSRSIHVSGSEIAKNIFQMTDFSPRQALREWSTIRATLILRAEESRIEHCDKVRVSRR